MATEETVSSLGGVVGILILAVIVIGILGFAFIYSDQFKWQNLQKIVPSLVPPIGQEELGAEGYVDLLAEARTGSDYTTATEVGCEIATAIRDDYAANGDEKETRDSVYEKDFTDLRGIGSGYYIIKSGLFSIPIDSTSPKSYAGLSAQAKNKLSEICAAPSAQSGPALPSRQGAAGGSVNQLSPCSDKLDEACVTWILKNLKVEQLPICGEIFVGSGTKVKATFGNNNCGTSVNGNWLKDRGQNENCKNLCGSKNKITGFEQIGLEQKAVSSLASSEQSVSSSINLGQNKFVPDCKIKPCNPLYRYILYWHRGGNHYYEISVDRVPQADDIGKISTTELSSKLAKIFKSNLKGEDAGARYRDLRHSVNITFEPSERVQFKTFSDDFIKNLKKEDAATTGRSNINLDSGGTAGWTNILGENINIPTPGKEKWDSIFELCSDESSCFENELQTTKYKEIVNNEGKGIFNTQLDTCDKVDKDFRQMRIRSSLDPNRDYLEPGKKYKLILNQWRYKQRTSYNPTCQGLGLDCVVCINDACSWNVRWKRDCIIEGSFLSERFDLADVTEWKDFSLIIVPVEEEPTATTTLRGATTTTRVGATTTAHSTTTTTVAATTTLRN